MAKIMAQDRAEPDRQTRNGVRHWTTSDLRSRGWSNGLIEKLLGEPDRTIPNRYRKSNRINAYLVERTLQAEQDPVFLAAVGKTQARREAARRAATTRLRNAIQWAASTKILLQCPTRSLDELQQVAVVTRNAFLFRVSRNHEELELLPDPRELDRPTLDRLCANLLRPRVLRLRRDPHGNLREDRTRPGDEHHPAPPQPGDRPPVAGPPGGVRPEDPGDRAGAAGPAARINHATGVAGAVAPLPRLTPANPPEQPPREEKTG